MKVATRPITKTNRSVTVTLVHIFVTTVSIPCGKFIAKSKLSFKSARGHSYYIYISNLLNFSTKVKTKQYMDIICWWIIWASVFMFWLYLFWSDYQYIMWQTRARVLIFFHMMQFELNGQCKWQMFPFTLIQSSRYTSLA